VGAVTTIGAEPISRQTGSDNRTARGRQSIIFYVITSVSIIVFD
jgi:hypothetical protein